MRLQVRLVPLALVVAALASCGKNASPEFVGTWFDAQGQPAPDRVIEVGLGSKHCGLQSLAFMTLGWPVGTPDRDTNVRTFIRDPQGVLAGSGQEGPDTDAQLPAGATDTGFHHGRWGLWVTPSDANHIYLVRADRVERWPLQEAGCA